MDFSLSSSLVGSAVSNPDKLALDLQFATDKTLTARKGPTPAFTRASSGTFVGSNGLIQSAGNNVARFDHDPVTLACKGLLIEESRTNSIADSNAFNNWSMSNSTVAASSVANPEGSLSAWKVVEDLLLAIHTAARSFSPVSGTTYTASMWLKSAENGFAFMGLSGGGFATTFISVNLSTGAVSTAIGTPIGATSVTHSNGWWRVSFSLAATASLSSTISVRLSRDGDWANRSYLGNGVNGIYCYGAQVEAGSFPTSYIPTTTTGLTRSADVCSISGSAFTGFWNQTSGTMLKVFEASPNTNTTYVSASNGNITQNSIHFDNDTGNMRAVYYSGSSIVATLSLGSVGTVGEVNKIASAYSVNDFSASRNGGAVVVDSSGAVPASLSQINIGTDERSQTPVSFYSNRCIKSLRYYKKRLSNAKLQALTASVIVLSGIGSGLGSGSSIVASESPNFSTYDIDAQNYITAVEAADGQSLEAATRLAINTFIEGCKSDGIWNAIKSSCILAGARTLSGALVPLAGIAPTNANFVSSDYDRKTGLVGNGSTKFINSNRNNNADPRNNYHASVYLSSIGLDSRAYIGAGGANTTGTTHLLSSAGSFVSKNRFPTILVGGLSSLGFLGHSRSAGDAIKLRHNLTEYLANYPSSEPYPYNAFVFARNANDLPQAFASGRISFYSIGEDLDLALLDARISNLMTTFSSSIS